MLPVHIIQILLHKGWEGRKDSTDRPAAAFAPSFVAGSFASLLAVCLIFLVA